MLCSYLLHGLTALGSLHMSAAGERWGGGGRDPVCKITNYKKAHPSEHLRFPTKSSVMNSGKQSDQSLFIRLGDRCSRSSVSSIQDDISALGKAHTRSIPLVRSVPNVAFEIISMFVRLTMAFSRPFKKYRRAPPPVDLRLSPPVDIRFSPPGRSTPLFCLYTPLFSRAIYASLLLSIYASLLQSIYASLLLSIYASLLSIYASLLQSI